MLYEKLKEYYPTSLLVGAVIGCDSYLKYRKIHSFSPRVLSGFLASVEGLTSSFFACTCLSLLECAKEKVENLINNAYIQPFFEAQRIVDQDTDDNIIGAFL